MKRLRQFLVAALRCVALVAAAAPPALVGAAREQTRSKVTYDGTYTRMAYPMGDVDGDYLAGDLVTCMLPGNLPHIGIVSDRRLASGRPLVIHNIGAGSVEDDILFAYPVTGHYRHRVQ